MKITLTEPISPRYLWVNPATNHLHILMPVVGGVEIGTDNTCKALFSLQEFFFGNADDVPQRTVRDELHAYQKALKFDLNILGDHDTIKSQKIARLQQIEHYINALETLLRTDTLNSLSRYLPEYPALLKERITRKDSNLHSILLCPAIKDDYLRFANPVFSVDREGKGALYRCLSEAYRYIPLPSNAKTRFIHLVLNTLAQKENDFVTLQKTLTALARSELDQSIDFTLTFDKVTVTQTYLDELLGSDQYNPSSAKDYIDMLLALCAPKGLFENLTESPFYTWENAEALTIITQFFFGITNIYCKTHGLSELNFGAVLDNNQTLCEEVAGIVLSMTTGENTEKALIDFLERYNEIFGLTKAFSTLDNALIKEKFIGCYYTIKRPENVAPHFDEFIFLDTEKKSPFVTHKGSICLNFAEFLQAAVPNESSDYFKDISDEFNALTNNTLTHTNPCVHASIELSVEALLEKIPDEDHLQVVLDKLPDEQKKEVIKHQFLLHVVARGEQDMADRLLEACLDKQFLLTASQSFTDYSRRTFNCSAFEYAWWAKDTHMCRMLMNHMDNDTKVEMLNRCNVIEEQGLIYKQHEGTKRSKHFDFQPLKRALEKYVDGFYTWEKANNWGDIKAAWMDVGKAQRDIVAHVAQEYCTSDHCSRFNEKSFRRKLTFYNWVSEKEESWFTFGGDNNSGFGVDFAVVRVDRDNRWYTASARAGLMPAAAFNLAAITRLDEMRNDDLTQLRQELNVTGQSRRPGMSC
jgi:hypothetical protein